MYFCEFAYEWVNADNDTWGTAQVKEVNDVLDAIEQLRQGVVDGLRKGNVAISAMYSALNLDEIKAHKAKEQPATLFSAEGVTP